MSVKVQGVVIGEGMPKVCVPVMGRTDREVMASLYQALECQPDVIEWRLDWLERFEVSRTVGQETQEQAFRRKALSLLELVRENSAGIPLLLTFRSKREGGEQELSGLYADLVRAMVASGCIDLVDAELFTGDDYVRELVALAHEHGVAVVGSSHDFQATPDEPELIRRLERMQELGCDISKLAVMPNSAKDVLTLLNATQAMKAVHPEQTLITMSMGKTGMVSRLCGELTGSALTFGSAGQASAPGQVPVKQLREVLNLLHKE